MIQYQPIGIIHTPYNQNTKTPYQPVDSDSETDNFFVELAEEHKPALNELDAFRYIFLLYHIDQVKRDVKPTVSPPWAHGMEVGLFASRSPVRPNPIGLSVVRLLSIESNRLYTSGLDVFDGTPLLDIKPYVQDLDSKRDANHGWIDHSPDREHLTLHIRGIPHDY